MKTYHAIDYGILILPVTTPVLLAPEALVP
jgi:hypothetical protein